MSVRYPPKKPQENNATLVLVLPVYCTPMNVVEVIKKMCPQVKHVFSTRHPLASIRAISQVSWKVNGVVEFTYDNSPFQKIRLKFPRRGTKMNWFFHAKSFEPMASFKYSCIFTELYQQSPIWFLWYLNGKVITFQLSKISCLWQNPKSLLLSSLLAKLLGGVAY